MTASTTTLNTRELQPRIGTEIRTDKAILLSAEHAHTLRDLLVEPGVLVFPKVGFTDDEQVAFPTDTLGVFAPERTAEQVCSVTLEGEEPFA